MPNRFSTLLILLFATGIFLLAAWAYFPGLQGGFLFDDFGNLPALGDTGPVDNWAAFFRYITSGEADPTGRPLALLSFLVDAHNWPADPYSFKRTSLLLHLFNGLLLMLLLRKLGRLGIKRSRNDPVDPISIDQGIWHVGLTMRSDLAAVVGAAFWLLHPLFVSTTLYIVQREAMLPATFTLLGLLLWLHGRQIILRGRTVRGLAWIALGLGLCTMLAVLSKANGILLPVLALVIEYIWLTPRAYLISDVAVTQLASEAQTKRYRRIMLLFGWLPGAIVTGYLLHSGWTGFVHGVSDLRPWSMGQRLLTEPRVLMDYLKLLWLPRPFTPGLFNDQIQASHSLWFPIITLPALLATSTLIVGAWLLRRRFPAWAMVILFYFVGQSLESSTIPLELYFEHRNYLPAMLMFWPLALWLCDVELSHGSSIREFDSPKVQMMKPDTARITKITLAIMLLSGLTLVTHTASTLWGNTHDQAVLWAKLNPESPRAQANAALLEMAAGQPQYAISRLQASLRNDPYQVQVAFNIIGARCMLGALVPDDLTNALRAISHTRDTGTLLVHWFEESIPEATSGRCRGLDLNALNSLLDAGLKNAYLTSVYGRRQDLLYLKGHIELAQHNPAVALSDFNAAIDQDVRPGAALNQAALLGSAGYPQEALAHLDHYQSIQGRQLPPASGMGWLHAKILQHQHYWQTEMSRLRDTLHEDMKNQIKGNP